MMILMCTYSHNEPYVDLCVDILGQFWPGHPELVVCSDRGNFVYANKVVTPGATWTGVLAGGLRGLQDSGRVGERDQVLLLLEDHVPSGPVPTSVIERLLPFLDARRAGYVNLSGHGASAPAGKVEGCDIHVLDMYHFSSLHPAIWTVAHLARTLDYARENGLESPWQFECIRLPGSEHLTTQGVLWPSVHGGFLWQGRVNVPALRSMKQGAQKALRTMLLRKLAGEIPRRLVNRVAALSRPAA